MEILVLTNTVTKIKNIINQFKSRLIPAEEKIGELENKSIEESQIKHGGKSLCETAVPEEKREKENWAEEIFEEIMPRMFQN